MEWRPVKVNGCVKFEPDEGRSYMVYDRLYGIKEAINISTKDFEKS